MIKRGRRLRVNSAVRDMVRETILSTKDFIYPIFVVEGENIKTYLLLLMCVCVNTLLMDTVE